MSDGYTLMVSAPGALVVAPTLYKNPGYDPANDFAPVATLYSSPQMLVAHPTFEVNSIRDIVAYAKANPNKLSWGSPGLWHRAAFAGRIVSPYHRNRHRQRALQRRG